MATWNRISKAHTRLENFLKEETSTMMFYVYIYSDK